MHVPYSKEVLIADTISAVFLDFSLHSFGLVPTIVWDATKTIRADNTAGIEDMRVKEGDNIF